jgi:hypothetical protein
MMKSANRCIPAAIAVALVTAQASNPSAARNARAPEAWRTLFDGRSLEAWRGYKSDSMPAGWRVAGRALVKDGSVGDVMTKDEFGDFELELDWKIGEAGNSGVFYRGTEEYEHIYWSAPEYQLLDDVKAAELRSPDWEAKVMASKFADWPNFGRAKRGHIALQGDHEGSLGFKNIRIREVH